MVTVRLFVTLKPSLLDSAGRTVATSLEKLGFDEVHEARVGKLIELKMDHATPERIDAMCAKLLANPVIEDYRYEVVD